MGKYEGKAKVFPEGKGYINETWQSQQCHKYLSFLCCAVPGHCWPKDHPMGLKVGRPAATGPKEGDFTTVHCLRSYYFLCCFQ